MLLHPACFPLPIILFLYIQNDTWGRGKGEKEKKKMVKKTKRNTAMLLRDIIKIPNVVKTRIPPPGGHVV